MHGHPAKGKFTSTNTVNVLCGGRADLGKYALL